MKKLLRSVVKDLSPIGHLGLDHNNKDIIYLRNNENPFGSEYNRYPGYIDDGSADLPNIYLDFIQEIDCKLGAKKHCFERSNTIFTQGSASAFEQIIKAFFEPNIDSILLTPPYFSIYSRVAKIFNINICEVPLTGTDLSLLDVDKICSSKVKGIILCDPNNPIGSRINKSCIKRLVEQFDGLIIIDEAYVEYSRYPSNLSYIENNPNVVILRTMSKAFGMAGLRIGAVIAHSNIIDAISNVQLPFAISSIAAKYAYETLKKKDSLFKQIEMFKKERDRVYQALLDITCLSDVLGDDCGFISIKTKHMDDVVKLMRNNNLEPVFKPEGLNDWIRISIGSKEQNDRLIKTFSDFNF